MEHGTGAQAFAAYVAAMNGTERAAALAEVLADDFVFEGPVFEAYGLSAFVQALGPWLDQLPQGTAARVVGEVQEHHARFLARYAYVCGTRTIGSGWVMGELRADGKVARMTGFVDEGSDLPHQ